MEIRLSQEEIDYILNHPLDYFDGNEKLSKEIKEEVKKLVANVSWLSLNNKQWCFLDDQISADPKCPQGLYIKVDMAWAYTD